jgi:hypothetical protein
MLARGALGTHLQTQVSIVPRLAEAKARGHASGFSAHACGARGAVRGTGLGVVLADLAQGARRASAADAVRACRAKTQTAATCVAAAWIRRGPLRTRGAARGTCCRVGGTGAV